MLKYIIRRFLVLPVILFIVTVLLFLLILLQPVDQRVAVYLPSFNPHITPEQFQELLEATIHRYPSAHPPRSRARRPRLRLQHLVQNGIW